MSSSSNSSSGIGYFVVIIILSIISGLVFSIWSLISKRAGNGYLIQFVLAMLCIGFFGYYISYHLYIDYIPGDDKFSYYLGTIGTYTNGLAAIILFLTLFSKSE